MSTHTSIVDFLVSLGHKRVPGYCHGLSLKWIEACLLNEEPLFDARIKKMVSGGEVLVHLIHAVKEKKGQHLTAQDKELLDILAFCDSMELYQFPDVYWSIFNVSLAQDDIERISQVASSDAILSRGGLIDIYSEPGIYTKKEIKAYFDDLGVVIEKVCVQSKEPLGIVLSSSHHAIALTYMPGQGWKFMDINQYPSKSFTINNTILLAECIMRGFIQSNSPYRAFNVSVLTTGNQLGVLNLKETFDSFKKGHQITKKIAGLEAAEGIGLARIAAQCNHAPVIAELVKHGVDVNKADREGTTPAFIAAQEGFASVIVELAKHKVDLNKAKRNGVTPAYMAAQGGHALVIAELAKHQVDLNQVDKEGVTLAYIAAQNGHASVIAELAKHQVELNKAMNLGVTPAFIAAQNGHISVIAELIKIGVNMNTPFISSAASLREFAISRGDHVIERMNDFIAQQLALSSTSHAIAMTPYHIAGVMGHCGIVQLLNTKEEQDQNERLNTSHPLMEKNQSAPDKSMGSGYTFFSSSVNADEASNGVSQQENSDVYQDSSKQRTCYIL